MSVEILFFGKLKDGREVNKYVIRRNNFEVSLLSYGATVAEIIVPDKNGNPTDVLVGFDDIQGFEERTDYQGVVVGPYANRIGNAEFNIDDVCYKLTANEKGVTCLHGAGEFNTAIWDAEICDDYSVEFTYTSPDGTNGFPGNIRTSVKYTVTENNELKLEYNAVSDKKTFINLTNHAYFNLSGYDNTTILDHIIKINADKYTPVDNFSIPTGEIADVTDTPFDLRNPVKIGDGIDADFEQLVITGGYDHNFCINDYNGSIISAAEVYSEKSGIKLEVLTDLPGVQFYAGNFLNGAAGKAGKPMEKRSGFCLETQFYPDSPNKPEFPCCLFDAGEAFSSVTVFKFSLK